MTDSSTDQTTDAEAPESHAEASQHGQDSVAQFYEEVHQRGAEDPLAYHTEKVRDQLGHLADHIIPLGHGPPQIGVYKQDMRFYRDVLGGLRMEGYWVARVEVIGNYLRLTVQPDAHRAERPDLPTGVDKDGDSPC